MAEQNGPSVNGLSELGVAGAASAIRRREVSAEAYAGALLDRAHRYADLGAFITINESSVLAAAHEADKAVARGVQAPLLGVPMGVKDSYLTRGLKTSLGTGLLRDFVPERDAAVVADLKAAGVIIFGKTNLVEMSYGITGVNVHHGQAQNPYDQTRITGGSSSGSAAAVSARLVPAALGGDTVGSIRVPASLCGVVGFKPTPGRWSADGVAPISHTLDTAGVLARRVEDCALIDEIVAGPSVPIDPTDGLEDVRLAVAPRQFEDVVDPGAGIVLEEALARLRRAGADIVEVDLGEGFASLAARVVWTLFFGETARDITDFLKGSGVPTTLEAIYDQLTPEVKDAWRRSVCGSGAGRVSQDDLQWVRDVGRPQLQSAFGVAFAAADAIISPATRCPAPQIAKQASFPVAGLDRDPLFLAHNTFPASGAGLPAISVPMGLTADGLPVGIEIEGPPGDDRPLLKLAARIEAVLGPIPAPPGFG